MKIQPVTPYNVYSCRQNKFEHKNISVQNNVYNPIAYNPVNFTARLFRTPEDFYSCPWNKNGMPETMKQYLNADYEDRQHMPPQQMLSLVFDDINETKDLEQVKRIFPDEPLFKNLTDIPNKKARTGILAEIDLMKEDNKSLFKNGKDNLGHYIIKKIYIEGKTLKEINEDFNKDKSVYYNGLSPIEYDTLRAFGIKFPNSAFWKSFTHNRTNFNYTYTPRKPINSRILEGSAEKKSYAPQHNRYENVKDWEIDKLADALNKGYGSINETKKQLKKSSVNKEEHLNFVAKYMSEINSIVLERLQVSHEMRIFFENPENMSKSQKQKLEAYWQVPERREQRSLIMKDTIQNFFETYGVDGQNEEFQELLDYAHSIKPNRIAQMKEFEKIHNEKQAYYDEMFAELDAKEKSLENTVEEPEQKVFEDVMQDVKEKFNVDEYRFKIDNQEIVILSDIKKAFAELLEKDTTVMPKSLANRYINFFLNNDKVTTPFVLTFLLRNEDIDLEKSDKVMPIKDALELNFLLENEFLYKNSSDCIAAQQAVSEALYKHKPDMVGSLIVDLFQLVNIYNNLPEDEKKLILQDADMIKAKYNKYKKPLSDSEVRKISIQVCNMLRNYEPMETVIGNEKFFAGFNSALYSLSCYLKHENPSEFKNEISRFIKQYGGSLRVLINEDVSPQLKLAKLEQLFYEYSIVNPIIFSEFISRDKEGCDYIIKYSPYLLETFKKIDNQEKKIGF